MSLEDDGDCQVREQDRLMPIANLTRIMKKILPPHAKISDDAKETIQECVSEYISFVTNEANERCKRQQRKIVSAVDIICAMGELGLDEYVEPLSLYLHRYRELQRDRIEANDDHTATMHPMEPSLTMLGIDPQLPRPSAGCFRPSSANMTMSGFIIEHEGSEQADSSSQQSLEWKLEI